MQTQLLCFQVNAGDPTQASTGDKVTGRCPCSSESNQPPSFPLALQRETGETVTESRSAGPEEAAVTVSQPARAGDSRQIFATAGEAVEHLLPLQNGSTESEKTPVHETIIAAIAEQIGENDPEAAKGDDVQLGGKANPMTTAPVFIGSKTGETPAVSTNSDGPTTSDANGSVPVKGQIPAGRSAAVGQAVFSSASATTGNYSAADPHPILGGADSGGLERKDPLRTNQTDTARQSQGPGPTTNAPDTAGLQQVPVLPTSKHLNGGGKTVNRMMEQAKSAGHQTVDVNQGLSAETKAASEKGTTSPGNAADAARNSTEPILSELLEKAPERIVTDPVPRQGSVAAGDNRMSAATVDLQAAVDETVRSGKTNPGEIIDQIVKKAVIRFKDGISEARINLKPELLGHLRLSISTDNQQVTLRIITENPLVKEIIESSAAQLKADLSNQGLQMEQLEVGVNGDRDRLGHQSDNPGQASGQMTEKTNDAAADTDQSAENESSPTPASDSGKEIDTFV